MSDSRKLPPYRFWLHFQAAFGGLFGTLNLLVGAVSILRQLARAFHIGLSPVLKSIFAAYVQIFHGLVDFFARALTWLSGFDLSVPVWAHDWIVLWFVGAGAMFRLYVAAIRAHELEGVEIVSDPPGVLLPMARSLYLLIMGWEPRIGFVTARAISNIVIYAIIAVVWPLMLVEISLIAPSNYFSPVPLGKYARLSYSAVFWLQTLAITLAILGLSVLNAQTK